jgi:hypothetical protein
VPKNLTSRPSRSLRSLTLACAALFIANGRHDFQPTSFRSSAWVAPSALQIASTSRAASGQTRSFGEVGSMSGLPESGLTGDL